MCNSISTIRNVRENTCAKVRTYLITRKGMVCTKREIIYLSNVAPAPYPTVWEATVAPNKVLFSINNKYFTFDSF